MIVQEHTPSFWHLFTAARGSVGAKIIRPVLYLDLWAVIVSLLYIHYGIHTIDMTPTPFTIIGLVFGLFLSFRNNISYNRFWEARTLWGRCIIATRNLSRQVLVFGNPVSEQERHERVYMIIAFAHALRHYLRGTDPTDDLTRCLSPEMLADVMSSPNVPARILMHMGRDQHG